MANAILTIPAAGGAEAEPGNGPASDRVSFVAGPENRLLSSVVEAVLELPGTEYNPLVLHGPSGTGKSHLALAICEHWNLSDRRAKPVCCPAADFAHELVDAIETQAMKEFRHRYRRTSLLIIDDLQHLCGKENAQRELASTIDALLVESKQVIVTCNAAPNSMKGLLLRLRSRLAAGLTLALASPGVEARAAIIGQLAERRGLRLERLAMQSLAESVGGHVAELRGLLLRLEAEVTDREQTIGVDTVRRVLEGQGQPELPSVHQIALTAARVFGVPLAQMRGKSRRRAVATARHAAMFLARHVTGESLNGIGRYFGDRDHTTVMHGCRRTEELADNEPEIRHALKTMKEKLRLR